MELFAFFTAEELAPVFVFGAIVAGTFWVLSAISSRNSQAEERLERIGRPKSLLDIDVNGPESRQRFAGIKDMFSNLGGAMEPQSELEKNTLRVKLANAGFRSEQAASVYLGLRVVCLVGFLLPALFFFLLKDGFTLRSMEWTVFLGGLGFYLPQITLWYMVSTRQKEIFLTLPDALDLLVVCVESGLGLDAALRKVTEEMKGHAKILCEEFQLANLQLQMGRPRREVLHDLGVRTGVDDVRSLAAILIQADRFGSSIAQALRVQSDSMRTRRRQLAEEKAAKTAVQLIFPLVLFIFPAIFVVLVGPAAIQISRNLLKAG
ncbi:type II secretion system F family protein [Urbifossiella limnaea]|uniref:Bacterial type II secretion system protein F domain protein n=1 Tax=Urbifossiella limnaea TaxID=2528023 RepID=A0A517XM82_9BACT|nr:type II secretion system F family protein [Urbifossiella limnaea]QDU18576.1 Bacterial type II secretion system protein F domain protein [Urbifossiella limnaea]